MSHGMASGTARPCGHSLTLRFLKHSLFKALRHNHHKSSLSVKEAIADALKFNILIQFFTSIAEGRLAGSGIFCNFVSYETTL